MIASLVFVFSRLEQETFELSSRRCITECMEKSDTHTCLLTSTQNTHTCTQNTRTQTNTHLPHRGGCSCLMCISRCVKKSASSLLEKGHSDPIPPIAVPYTITCSDSVNNKKLIHTRAIVAQSSACTVKKQVLCWCVCAELSTQTHTPPVRLVAGRHAAER